MSKQKILILGLLALLSTQSAVWAQSSPMYRWVDAKGVAHYSDLPPPPDAHKVETRKLTQNAADETPGYLMRKATEDYPVTLYTANGCGEVCDSAKSLLTKRGIPFTEQVVRTKSEQDAYRQRFNGAEQVPGLAVGQQTQVGFEETSWSRLLDNAGYPKAGAAKPASGQSKPASQ